LKRKGILNYYILRGGKGKGEKSIEDGTQKFLAGKKKLFVKRRDFY